MLDLSLESRFSYHAPKPGQPATYEAMRAKGLELAQHIKNNTPCSPEQCMAINKVDEAIMWANAAIARHGLQTRVTDRDYESIDFQDVIQEMNDNDD